MKIKESAKADESSMWRNNIAEQANVSLEEVNALLTQAGIRPSPIPATPTRITINRIEFTGRKVDTQFPARDGEFQFLWDDLSAGPWVMMTDGNLKGKSSVIEIVKWMLRGNPSSDLQEDVRGWLDSVSLEFHLGEKQIKVEVTLKGKELNGRLLQIRGNREAPLSLSTFSSPDEFQESMSSFFMKGLDLEIIQAFRKDSEGPTTHDWQALAGALFIGTDYKALLGEVVQDGLAGSLLRMYLGLPWISTISVAKAKLKATQREQDRHSSHRAEDHRRHQQRLEQLDKILAGKRQRLQNTPSDKEIRNRHREAVIEATRISNQLREWGMQRIQLATAFEEASAAYNEDRRELLRFHEEAAAHSIFRALDPEMCPRCERHIGEDRRQRERDTHGCSVCGEQIPLETDDPEERRQALREQLDASKVARTQAQTALQKLDQHLVELQAEESKVNRACDELGKILNNGFDDYFSLQSDVKMLEKEREALQALLDEGEQPPPLDLAILQAVVKVTENQVAGLKEDLLNNVSQEIVRLAKEFGMTAITETTLRGNASLEISKGGKKITYSKLTGGEKLRLKVATVLAMLNVAEKTGLGRHPGLLFIDSPKNHQMIDKDFEHLLKGLRSAITTLPHLQIFVASTSSSILQKWIGNEENRIHHAKGEEYLW
ncbi:MAG: hypothetical protein HQL79_07365 [Magnetococcales bacterium]|nr:hypothetical protein [Magnetococcales bacterium]